MTEMNSETTAAFIGIVLAQFVVNVVTLLQNRKVAFHVKEAKAEAEKAATKTDEAAVKIETVRTDLIESNATVSATAAKQDEKLDRIHQLVNGEMSRQKEKTAIALRKVASVTGNPEDIKEAEAAEQTYMEHRAKLQQSGEDLRK